MKFVAALALVASMTLAMETENYGGYNGGYNLGRRGGYGLPRQGRSYGHGALGNRDLGRQYGNGGYNTRSYKPAPQYRREVTYAKCMLKDPEEENYLGGTINMRQEEYGDVYIWGDIWGVKPGKHGFHVHELGDLRQGCKSLAGHFNGVDGAYYDSKAPGKRFIGDLKSAAANRNGDARIDQVDKALTLNGPESIIGRSLVLHGVVPPAKGGDSYGVSYVQAAGPRIACCTIGRTDAPKRSGYRNNRGY